MSDKTVDLSDIESPARTDFVRWNGTPAVMLPDRSKRVRYSRPSGAGKVLDDTTALEKWKIRTALLGAAENKSILPAVIAANGDKKVLNELAEKAIERGKGSDAADHGTALHALTEQIDMSERDLDSIPETERKRMVEYIDMLERFGLGPLPEFVEVKIVQDVLRYAGTGDRIFRCLKTLVAPDGTLIEPGDMIGADLKTNSGDLSWSILGYEVQSALYFGEDSMGYDVETEERYPLPDRLRHDWGLLIHMPSDGEGCEPVWLDLRRGQRGAELARGVKSWRQEKKPILVLSDPIPDAVVVLEEPGDMVVDLMEGSRQWITDRLTALKSANDPGVLEMLGRLWPGGVVKTADEATLWAMDDAVSKVEAAFGTSFIPGPPTPTPERTDTVIPQQPTKPYVEDMISKPADSQALDVLRARLSGIPEERLRTALLSCDNRMALTGANVVTYERFRALCIWLEIDTPIAVAAAFEALGHQHLDVSRLSYEDATALAELGQQFADGHLAVSSDGTALVPTTMKETTQ